MLTGIQEVKQTKVEEVFLEILWDKDFDVFFKFMWPQIIIVLTYVSQKFSRHTILLEMVLILIVMSSC